MRKLLALSASVLASLCACSQQPALPPTSRPAAQPPPVPALASQLPEISSVNEVLLNNRAVLPSGASSAEIGPSPHPAFAELPPSQGFTSIIYSLGPEFVGRLTLFLYAYPEELDSAWPLVLDLIPTPKEVSGLGDLAAVNHTDLAFIRCAGLVHLKFASGIPAEIISFAEMIDGRLAPLLCGP